MRRRIAMLLAGTCVAAVAAVLVLAARLRPPEPAEAVLWPPAPPSLTTSVATTATAAPRDDPMSRSPGSGGGLAEPGESPWRP
ncbi:hypothetical protein [Amycolatopsis tolypomycina]|nr:hypothetical protein [Amycolatopsis tolypomycina]